jgi:hypothetical protein
MEHELADGKKFFVSAGTEWKQRSCGLKAQKKKKKEMKQKRSGGWSNWDRRSIIWV